MKQIVIAIDGYSSTGKSTIAKALAKRLAYKYIDTGAMYRAVTLFAIRNNYIVNSKIDEPSLIAELHKINISFRLNTSSNSEVCLDQISVESEIRGMNVSKYVSLVSAIPQVRSLLVAQQKKMGENKGVVMDGRDIGSVVFPEAELKLFMTATENVRAKRRYDELILKGENVSYEEVMENLKERDYRDTHRKIAPLIQMKDAIVLDNSNMTQVEQLDWVCEKVDELLMSD